MQSLLQLMQGYNIRDYEAQNSGGQAAVNEQTKVVTDPNPIPRPDEPIERDSKFRVPHNPNYVTQKSNAESLMVLSPTNSCRYDSSLGKFSSLL